MISAATLSAAWGSIIHSACSITRLCRLSGLSPGSTSTAFWAIILPPSGISFTKCTVAPVTSHPVVQGRLVDMEAVKALAAEGGG